MKTLQKFMLLICFFAISAANAQVVYQPQTQTTVTTTTTAPTSAVAKPKAKKQWKWYPGCCATKKWTTTKTTVVNTVQQSPVPMYRSVVTNAPKPIQTVTTMQQTDMQQAPVITDAENTFPLKGNAGIGTLSPNAALEIRRNAGNGDNKNYMLSLSNEWSEAGLNEPSIMFNNGDVGENFSYWTMGARVSGDKAHDNPIAFKIGFKPPREQNEREFMSIDAYNGRVKIGNCNSNMDGYKLFVEEGILTEKVKVAVKNSDEWFDTVFEPDYKIMPIKDLDTYIKTYKHLPDIPTTKEVMENGLDVGKMNGLLLKKVEELTLYMIDLKKELDQAKKEIEALKK
jgi:hypothetical protein